MKPLQGPTNEAPTTRIAMFDLGRTGRRVLSALFDRGFRSFVLADEQPVAADEIVGDPLLLPGDVGHPRAALLAARLAERDSCEVHIEPGAASATAGPTPWNPSWLADCALGVVACETPQRHVLLHINQACLASGTPLLSGLALGWFGLAGPLVRAGQGPCLLCMDLRITATAGRSCLGSPVPAQPHAIDLVSKALIDDIGRFFGEVESEAAESEEESRKMRLDGGILFYCQHGSETPYPLLRTSRCPACSGLGPFFPYRFAKRLDFDAPAEGRPITELQERLVSPMTGPLKIIQDFPTTPADPPAAQWTATVTDVGALSLGNAMIQSGGTDLDSETARAAALGEAVERMASACANAPDCFGATWNDISEEAVDPLVWDLFHPRTRALQGFPFAGPPVRDQPMSWLWADSLTEGRPKAVCVSRVFAFFQSPAPADHFDFTLVSGFATAPTLVEATWHGLLEVLERDSFMISWMNRLPMRRVEIEEGTEIDQYVRNFRSKGIEVRCSTIQLDLGVHLVVAMGRSEQPGDPSSFLCAAADISLTNACRRAIRELIAARLYIRGELGRARAQGQALPRPVPEDNVKMGDHGLLYARPEMRRHLEPWWNPEESVRLDLEEAAPAAYGEGLEEVRKKLDALVRKLQEAGLEVLVADITPPEIREMGLRVTKTMVPGTYPMNFDSRFPHLGGRRMSEVPVRLGFRDQPTEYDQFQKIPHPFP